MGLCNFAQAHSLRLLAVVINIYNDICAGIYAQGAAVEAEIVVLRLTPGPAGVVLVIYAAALILFLQSCLRTFLGFAVKPDDPVCTEIHIRVDINVKTILTVFENIVGISAYDHTRALISKL